MKKLRHYLAMLIMVCLIGLSYLACRKSSASDKSSSSALIQSYRNYFEANVQPLHNPDATGSSSAIRMTLHKTPNWDRAFIQDLSFGKTVVVPLLFKEKIYLQSQFGEISLDSTSYLILYMDGEKSMHSEVVTKIPDVRSLSGVGRSFTGITTVEDWGGRPLKSYKYTLTGMMEVKSKITGGTDMSAGAGSKVQVLTEEQATCDIYTYYLCPSDATDVSECQYEYTYADAGCSAGGGGGGSGGGTGPITEKVIYDYNNVGGDATFLSFAQLKARGMQFTFPASGNPILDIQNYTHCFDGTGTTYSVALLVDQPAPGLEIEYTENAAGSTPLFNVGHTFMEFSETLANGTVITRYIGLYPATTLSAWTQSTTAVFGNDQLQPYTAGLTIQVSSSQFGAILAYMTNISSLNYNVYTNNCTTMALNALAQGGYVLTPDIGYYPSLQQLGTAAETAGDLGWYIANTSFPSSMTVTTGALTSGANAGTCP